MILLHYGQKGRVTPPFFVWRSGGVLHCQSAMAWLKQFGMKFVRFALVAALAIAGCQSAPEKALDVDNFQLPLKSAFVCNNGETINIENKGSLITVSRGDGSTRDLPAVQGGGNSRFSEGQVAVVFDGNSALYMDTGKPPMECRR
jgi:hypothetical protein